MRQRSFLKWAGNKYNCLNIIIPEFPQAARLIEPFTGSATIFLNTKFPKNILAEQNLDLINLFTSIKKEGDAFIQYSASLFTTDNNSEDKYYQLREKFNAISDPIERSALFLYLNKHGFNGLCRYNSQGIYNVPFGLYTKPYFPQKELELFMRKSKEARFIHSDFVDTFKIAKPGDLVYCDPPYSPIEQESNFSAYTSTKFAENEHIKLAKLAKNAAKRGVKVIISNHDTEFTREQYQGATIKSFTVSRFISRAADRRLPVKELIAIF